MVKVLEKAVFMALFFTKNVDLTVGFWYLAS